MVDSLTNNSLVDSLGTNSSVDSLTNISIVDVLTNNSMMDSLVNNTLVDSFTDISMVDSFSNTSLVDFVTNISLVNKSMLQLDKENIFLNPQLHPPHQVQFILDGIVLPGIALLGLLPNLLILGRLPWTKSFLTLRLLAVTDLLLLFLSTWIFTPPAWPFSAMLPNALRYLVPLLQGAEGGSTYLTLMFCFEDFMARTGERPSKCLHLQVLQILLCMTMVIPAFWEREITVEDGEYILRFSAMYYQHQYKNIYRGLFFFLLLQVIPTWIFPIVFLMTKDRYKLDKKKRRPGDLLIPSLSIFFLVTHFMALYLVACDIILLCPDYCPDYLYRFSTLSLSFFASFKILLFVAFRPSMRAQLFCSKPEPETDRKAVKLLKTFPVMAATSAVE